MSKFNNLVIFDCDGTLVDGQHLIVEAMHRTFLAQNMKPVSDEDVRSIIGLSLLDAMENLLPEADTQTHQKLADQYKISFVDLRKEQRDPIEPLYDGVLDVIKTLDDAGFVLGVATGKSMRGLVRVLEHHGVKDKFVTLQTADGHPSKPHPSMVYTAMREAGSAANTTIMVGDTSYDMQMAKTAGVAALGVSWGYHDAYDLCETGADHVANYCHELPALIDALIKEA